MALNSVVLGKLVFEVHAVVEYSTNLDPASTAGPVQKEMARVLHSSVCNGNEVAAVPKVVGSCGSRNF